ncbi:MAG: hypothetical protein JKY65_26400 [Planctomycetes bacterium]|nr:hypothetical protein [Planctomycetota bacterium]
MSTRLATLLVLSLGISLAWPPFLAVVVASLFVVYLATSAAAHWRAASSDALPTSSVERGRRCPFCHDDLESGETVEACGSCETAHHAECREEFGACATLGCEAPESPARRFVIAAAPTEGWDHPEAIEIDGEVATPFPDGVRYHRQTGLRVFPAWRG